MRYVSVSGWRRHFNGQAKLGERLSGKANQGGVTNPKYLDLIVYCAFALPKQMNAVDACGNHPVPVDC
ncbi:MAG: hypothetical protein H5T86_12585 [Armatimonadetes bacterium]|nr:hypothetical protein [Armatimonadota bacterium]